MKAKTLALLSILMLAVIMLTIGISADAAAKQDIYDAVYEACPANYRKYYMGTVQNILSQIDVNRTQADSVIEIIRETKDYFDQLGDCGPSLSDYGHVAVEKGVGFFKEACDILNIGYTFTTLPEGASDHVGDQTVSFTYNGKHIGAVDGDDLINPGSSGSGSPTGTTYYTVNFETNGGSEVIKQRVKRNANVTEPEIPTKEGFAFAGWYTDENFKNAFDFKTKIKENITLYAKWTEAVEPTPDTWDNPYDDVYETDWYYGYVKTLTELGIMTGVSDNKFVPSMPLTRGMFVTILHRIEGSPAANDCAFEDVADGAWYEAGISWANESGIVTGFSDKEFRPDIPITREQMAAILFRYAVYKGMGAVTLQESLHFSDAGQISEYAIPAMNWAVGANIIRGNGDGTVTPTAYATRAQVTAVFVRFLEFTGAIK